MQQSRQVAKEIDGILTEILLQQFADRVLVLVTQLNKVGNLIQATIPPTAPLLPAPPTDPSHPNEIRLPPPSPAIELSGLLGSAPTDELHTLHALYTTQIATLIWNGEAEKPLDTSRRSVVVGIALKKRLASDEPDGEGQRRVFLTVMQMLVELLAS